MIFKLLILSLIVFASNSKSFNPKKVILAVNCGSNQGSKSSFGFTYQAVY